MTDQSFQGGLKAEMNRRLFISSSVPVHLTAGKTELCHQLAIRLPGQYRIDCFINYSDARMEFARQSASAPLRSIVARFTQRRADLGTVARLAALPARPNQMIEIYLAERYGVGWEGDTVKASPEIAVIGPQSRPGLTLHLSGCVDVFTIHFQPTGLHRLLGIPMPIFVNEGVDLVDLRGQRARALHDAVATAQGFAERVTAAEQWLIGATEGARSENRVDHTARVLVRSAGSVGIAELAARSDLSLRQFERRFAEAVGMSPKLYGRTVRLARALNSKERRPELGWAEIAVMAGYADQAHLVRDCTALAGAPPARFVAAQEA